MEGAHKLAGEDRFIIGVTKIDGAKLFVYDRESLLDARCEALRADDPTLSQPEAYARIQEDYLFNTVDGWVGETTPAFIDTDIDVETAGELFDGSLGPSPVGHVGFLGVAERAGMDACYAFDTETEYRPTDDQVVMYVDTDLDALAEWLED